MWCSATDTLLKLLDRVVTGESFLTGGVFECDITHRRSVVVLCMLYKIRRKPMHPRKTALPAPYVPVRVTRSALVTHRYTWRLLAAEPRSSVGPLFPYQYISQWNDLGETGECGAGEFQEHGQ